MSYVLIFGTGRNTFQELLQVLDNLMNNVILCATQFASVIYMYRMYWYTATGPWSFQHLDGGKYSE
jgi:hypothetical protein